ncbi:unnamed protein product [Notodromas monacha]|uniref:Uncharacterized protein n=1 Tax=Notodromas monacha TaxID=399045 RepID=A0A7R9BG46_9CRUS|nr:unnamed protein product [Notodromas monacha]CAG0914114.1 unnamed protein product [Notodromas monacha]
MSASEKGSLMEIPGILHLEQTKRARHAAVVKAAERNGWKLTEANTKGHILWADTSWTLSIRFNHFPGMNELSRKDFFAKNLRRMKEQFPADYDIFPDSWILPMESDEWRKHSEENGNNQVYIVKPWNGSEGQGITLTQVPHVVASHLSPQVAQVYVQDPLTIDGYKLDLRIYVLVTSVCPLRLYMYSEGLTRFATIPYAKADRENLSNHFLHLTNYTINKTSSAYSRDELLGSKRRFSTLNKQLETRGINVAALWRRIDGAVVKCIIAALPKLQAHYDRKHKAGYPVVPACFELLGFDVLLTRDLRPLVLEVNFLPSMHVNTSVDQAVKVPMMIDVLNMVNPNAPTLRRLIRDTQKFSFQLFQSRFASKKAPNSAESESIRELWDTYCEEKVKEVADFEMSQRGKFRRIYPPVFEAIEFNSEISAHKVAEFLTHAANTPLGSSTNSVGESRAALASSGSLVRLRSSVSSEMKNPKLGQFASKLSRSASRSAKLERNESMPDVTDPLPNFNCRTSMRHSLRRATMVKQTSLPAMPGRTNSCCSASTCSLSSCSSSCSSCLLLNASQGFSPLPISEVEERARLDALVQRNNLLTGMKVRERVRQLKRELEKPMLRVPLSYMELKSKLPQAKEPSRIPCLIGIQGMKLVSRPAPESLEKKKRAAAITRSGNSVMQVVDQRSLVAKPPKHTLRSAAPRRA